MSNRGQLLDYLYITLPRSLSCCSSFRRPSMILWRSCTSWSCSCSCCGSRSWWWSCTSLLLCSLLLGCWFTFFTLPETTSIHRTYLLFFFLENEMLFEILLFLYMNNYRIIYKLSKYYKYKYITQDDWIEISIIFIIQLVDLHLNFLYINIIKELTRHFTSQQYAIYKVVAVIFIFMYQT